ncbi:DUF1330 domain-containing protein [Simiduia sp. 21SJ11W-1]|uniref:DUF1330 domain-containing protein n=1 Tax=Simiduia sp. 21SJ11W-1 TaxID=2909669 RepID=UPI00209D5621|nr:DUF1330 domain-containing protein [Simiduia sp. 21SJ11W-1]UTA47135.1 DUF1330 domain-containing protein [Simiduia sp. 21SJ11W-1]
MPVLALNLFDVANKEEYLAYVRKSGKAVASHGGEVISIGKFREARAGDLAPRQVMILVQWQSVEHFENYCNNPALADMHPHREKGTSNYIWQLFDKLEDFRPLLKAM